MDNWLLWELILLEEGRVRATTAPLTPPVTDEAKPGLRKRLASLLVATGLRLDAEAGDGALRPLESHR